VHVQRELRLLLLDQALWRAGILEAQILDVLTVQGERGRLQLGGGSGTGRRRRGVSHPVAFARYCHKWGQARDRAGGTMQGCAAQGADRAGWQAIANRTAVRDYKSRYFQRGTE